MMDFPGSAISRPLVLAALFGLASVSEAACRVESGATKRSLVELYTSEGCSSCPPADRWLSSLRSEDNLVPLAFHVDYWDYIGWRDRFASPVFSRRQQARVQSSGARFAYTPQVLVSGRDHPGWRQQPTAELQRQARQEADIAVKAEQLAEGKLRYHVVARLFSPNKPGGETAVAYVALKESGLVTQVKTGENTGERLTHDHVVREWIGPLAFDADGRLDVRRELRRTDIAYDRAGLTVIVEAANGGRVLQALNLPLGSACTL